jgi:uncharacterized membrane protein YfcA
MVKPIVVAGLACFLIGVAISAGVNAVDAGGEVLGFATIIGACVAGLIGAEVARHLPPPKQSR